MYHEASTAAQKLELAAGAGKKKIRGGKEERGKRRKLDDIHESEREGSLQHAIMIVLGSSSSISCRAQIPVEQKGREGKSKKKRDMCVCLRSRNG